MHRSAYLTERHNSLNKCDTVGNVIIRTKTRLNPRCEKYFDTELCVLISVQVLDIISWRSMFLNFWKR